MMHFFDWIPAFAGMTSGVKEWQAVKLSKNRHSCESRNDKRC